MRADLVIHSGLALFAFTVGACTAAAPVLDLSPRPVAAPADTLDGREAACLKAVAASRRQIKIPEAPYCPKTALEAEPIVAMVQSLGPNETGVVVAGRERMPALAVLMTTLSPTQVRLVDRSDINWRSVAGHRFGCLRSSPSSSAWPCAGPPPPVLRRARRIVRVSGPRLATYFGTAAAAGAIVVILDR